MFIFNIVCTVETEYDNPNPATYFELLWWEGKDISKKVWFEKVLVQLLLKFIIKKLLGMYVYLFF